MRMAIILLLFLAISRIIPAKIISDTAYLDYDDDDDDDDDDEGQDITQQEENESEDETEENPPAETESTPVDDEKNNMADEDWLNTAVKDIAFYLRAHKFNDFDRRHHLNEDTAPRTFFKEFPDPPLRTLHWEVRKYCELGFQDCVQYLHEKVLEATFRRNVDTLTVSRENNWSRPNNTKQIEEADRECQRLRKLDWVTAFPNRQLKNSDSRDYTQECDLLRELLVVPQLRRLPRATTCVCSPCERNRVWLRSGSFVTILPTAWILISGIRTETLELTIDCPFNVLPTVSVLKVLEATFRRNVDTLTVSRENNWSRPNNTKQIEEADKECQRLRKLDWVTGEPFVGPLERFQWRTSASYYMCMFTMREEPSLAAFGELCDNFANCLDPDFGDSNGDPRADDRLPFQCATYSFCPDTCCPRKHYSNLEECWHDDNNPCHEEASSQCSFDRLSNTDFVSIALNRWNVSCICDEVGYKWDSRFGICIGNIMEYIA
ncbi:hypothetical protein B7P43_G08946 [Cryptotermes secundus]|uniref:Uncharacterized protein n=1 Tax=Cryptotermes secundus TaxID=105785 RepID=A0A2J7QL37_9NEOP|nr:hypothetical protein B7P43_G08946 [Cryptotermes secundus]